MSKGYGEYYGVGLSPDLCELWSCQLCALAPRRPRQAEYEQYTIDQGREMEALHQQHKAESHVLKMRVQDLEASFADAGRDEEVQCL